MKFWLSVNRIVNVIRNAVLRFCDYENQFINKQSHFLSICCLFWSCTDLLLYRHRLQNQYGQLDHGPTYFKYLKCESLWKKTTINYILLYIYLFIIYLAKIFYILQIKTRHTFVNKNFSSQDNAVWLISPVSTVEEKKHDTWWNLEWWECSVLFCFWFWNIFSTYSYSQLLFTVVMPTFIHKKDFVSNRL